MEFYFVLRPEPLIQAKRLEMGLLIRRARCAARRSGQRPGQQPSGSRLSQPPAKRQNPRHSRGSPNGASRTRTGGLLGAILALASPEFGLFCGVSAAVETRPQGPHFRPVRPISAGIGPKKRVFGPIRGYALLRTRVQKPVRRK